jgi:hypothetical protein
MNALDDSDFRARWFRSVAYPEPQDNHEGAKPDAN